MLVLSRKIGQRIVIGDITIQVADNGRLMFDAPPEVSILREELVNELRPFHCRVDSVVCPVRARSALEAAEIMVWAMNYATPETPVRVVVTDAKGSRTIIVGRNALGQIKVLT